MDRNPSSRLGFAVGRAFAAIHVTRLQRSRVGVLVAIVASGLLFGPVGPAGAAFPGGVGKIAFVSDRDGNREIYVMDAVGSGQTRVTNNPADDLEPAVSPNGAKVAFASTRDGN